MTKLAYNSDFMDLTEVLLNELARVIRDKFNWVYIMNGYVDGTNDTYYFGFRQNGKYYPTMFQLSIKNNWQFMSHRSFEVLSAEDYTTDVNYGGTVVFDKITEIIIEPQLHSLDVNNINGFGPEAEEYKAIKPVVITYDFTQKDEYKRKFTKADIKKITKLVLEELPNFLEEFEEATKKQAVRRFDELRIADEDLAMKYIPDDVKDIFVF